MKSAIDQRKSVKQTGRFTSFKYEQPIAPSRNTNNFRLSIKEKIGVQFESAAGSLTHLNKQGNVLAPAGPMRITLKNEAAPEANENEVSQSESKVPRKGLIELWQNKILKINIIASIAIWTHGSFNFYLITFFLKYFPGNIFGNAMAFAGADIVAYTCSGLVLKFISVRKGLVFAYTVALIGSIIYLTCFNTDKEWLIPLIVAFCRVGSSMSFNMGYVSVAKLFPTEYVATTFGIVNLMSHLITVLAPMVAEVSKPIPMIVFAANACLAIFFASMLTPLDEIKTNDKQEQLLKK